MTVQPVSLPSSSMPAVGAPGVPLNADPNAPLTPPTYFGDTTPRLQTGPGRDLLQFGADPAQEPDAADPAAATDETKKDDNETETKDDEAADSENGNGDAPKSPLKRGIFMLVVAAAAGASSFVFSLVPPLALALVVGAAILGIWGTFDVIRGLIAKRKEGKENGDDKTEGTDKAQGNDRAESETPKELSLSTAVGRVLTTLDKYLESPANAAEISQLRDELQAADPQARATRLIRLIKTEQKVTVKGKTPPAIKNATPDKEIDPAFLDQLLVSLGVRENATVAPGGTPVTLEAMGTQLIDALTQYVAPANAEQITTVRDTLRGDNPDDTAGQVSRFIALVNDRVSDANIATDATADTNIQGAVVDQLLTQLGITQPST